MKTKCINTAANLVTRFVLATALLLGSRGEAHDTWVEAGPLTARQGEYVYVQLMLGNHGNEHRDFRLASKITLAPCTLDARAPDGSMTDLKPTLIDMGSAEKEGYWTARYDLTQAGTHEFVHTLDTLHGTIRAIKSAKSYVIAQPRGPHGQAVSLDSNAGELRPLGHGLEILLRTPVTQLAAGREIQVQVLRSGKPLADARVTFVPRGVKLSDGFDVEHERTSDSQGVVSYTPAHGNVYLAVVHLLAADEVGEGYDKTHYSAALVLPVPNRAP